MWITLGLQKSILIRKILFAKFIKLHDINQKMKFTLNINSTASLLKRSKRSYFTIFLKNNLNNLQNIWKGIKNRISLKTLWHSSPSFISYNKKSSYQPFEIANAFHNDFSKVALNIQSSSKYPAKEIHEFLPLLNINSFLPSSTDKMK